VTIGFLAGIAVHIIASQLPSALGVAAAGGSTLHHLAGIVAAAPRFNPYALAIAAGVLALTALAHRLSARLPGALIAMAGATVAVVVWGLEARGVAVLGQVRGGLPGFSPPAITANAALQLAPIAMLIAIVILVQTAATTRAFPSDPDREANLSGDLVGVGVGNLLAGLLGAFPVNASPPRTAVVAESGGRSQISGLAAVAIVVLLLLAGTSLLSRVPQAALSGVLLFIALRIIRFGQIVEVAKSSPLELVLVLVTAAAIIVLPIATGVAVGIGLSLMHGMWSNARPRALIFERLPGTTVWWPKAPDVAGETLEGVTVLGFQAPLSFLNAYAFRAQVAAALANAAPPKLLVLEASGVVDIDFTGAQVFKDVIRLCREAGAALAIARLEGVDAQRDLTRLGLRDLIGSDHIFPTVAQAIEALAPSAKATPDPANTGPSPVA
jgi:MFS superfamily sulfate permease-like transporter